MTWASIAVGGFIWVLIGALSSSIIALIIQGIKDHNTPRALKDVGRRPFSPISDREGYW